MRILVLLALGWTTISSAQMVMLRDDNAAGLVDRAIVIPAREFSRKNVEDLCRKFLAQQKKYALLRLTVGTDSGEVARSLGHRLITAEKEDSVLDDLKRRGLPKTPIARLLARSGGALFSYRASERELSEQLFEGSADPTILRIGHVSCRLLHFTIAATRGAESQPHLLHVNLQCTPEVSAKAASELARLFARETSVPSVLVHLRPDAWFLGDPEYPDVYRFQREAILPNPLQAKLRPSVTCGLTRNRVLCSGTNFQP